MTGGNAIWRIAAYSYIADITEPEMRTKRIAFCDGMFLLGFNIGNVLAGPVKDNLGFGYNFSFGMLCSILAIGWCALCVKDSNEQRNMKLVQELEELEIEDKSSKEISQLRTMDSIEATHEMHLVDRDSNEGLGNCYGLFQLQSIKDICVTIFRKREGNKRMFVLLTVAAISIDSFAAKGKWNTSFLYFRKVLSWTLTEWSFYMTTLGMLGAVANYILVPLLSRKLLLHDSTISIIDTFTSVIR